MNKLMIEIFRSALPMLLNALVCFLIHRYCNIHHDFGLGVCFGGSFLIALRDAEKTFEDLRSDRDVD